MGIYKLVVFLIIVGFDVIKFRKKSKLDENNFKHENVINNNTLIYNNILKNT